jgi:hypothetical protein
MAGVPAGPQDGPAGFYDFLLAHPKDFRTI